MIVYRLARIEYTEKLYSSGAANRWNLYRQQVIYTSESIALCALELLAHTNGIRPTGQFGLMHINISDSVECQDVKLSQLPINWNTLASYPLTQQLGNEWYEKRNSLIMTVPSAIIPSEKNVVINTNQPDFISETQLIEVTDFFWDSRFPVN